MLTSFREHEQLILGNASDFVQPDAPRVGGISPFLKIMRIWRRNTGVSWPPHFCDGSTPATFRSVSPEPWLEHFEWLNPLFK